MYLKAVNYCLIAMAMVNLAVSYAFSQDKRSMVSKPVLTDSSYKTWTDVSSGELANNGKFASYVINNQPVGSKTFVVIATDKSWQKQFINTRKTGFSNNSRYLFCIVGKDSLLKIELGSNRKQLIPKCETFNLCKKEKNEYLVCRQTDSLKTVIVQNLNSGKELKFTNIDSYIVSESTGVIVIKTKDNQGIDLLKWIDIEKGKLTSIYKGNNSSNYIFDISGNNFAFTVDNKDIRNIYYYKNGSGSATLLANDLSTGIDKNLKISTDEIWNFNKNGDGLFFTLSEKNVPASVDNRNEPEIWNYQDQILRTEYEVNGTEIYKGSGRNLTFLDISQKKVKQLLKGLERLATDISTGNILVIRKFKIDDKQLQSPQKEYISYSFYLVKSGVFVPIKSDIHADIENIQISPDDRFIVYYEPIIKNIVSIDVSTGISKNISRNIKELGRLKYNTRSTISPIGIVRWLPSSHKAIIQGTYDLWEVDLYNRTAPQKLTKQKVVGHRVLYSFCTTKTMNEQVDESEDYYIKGFDLQTKEMSINVLNISKGSFIEVYACDCYASLLYFPVAFSRFQKAINDNAFLIKFERVSETPNYMFTRNFKNFVALSNVHPEKDYNWITSELLTYKDSLGNLCSGVLYKPENFDPSKKYPVLFTIYQEMTNGKNQFLNADPSATGINIPLIVSNGYLVFKPDVYSSKGKFGEMALTSVIAGLDALSKCSWIDTTKVCLAGHSLGGWEVNYIISKTNRFKAAISSAGASSAINNYNDLWVESGKELQGYVSYEMGGRLEDLTDIYVKTSPILYSEDINTPLLLMHNRQDANVQFYQSSQLFIQLRSLQKPVWLVAYPGESHMISKLKFKLDCQSKLKGYLDYYLKGFQMPDWLRDHITLK